MGMEDVEALIGRPIGTEALASLLLIGRRTEDESIMPEVEAPRRMSPRCRMGKEDMEG